MTLKEAIEKADKLRNLSGVESAKVERILPESADPIVDGANGWDVRIVTLHERSSRRTNKFNEVR